MHDKGEFRSLPLPPGEGRGEGVMARRFSLTLTLSQRERGFIASCPKPLCL